MTSVEGSVELTAEEFAKLDASRRRVAAQSIRLGQLRSRARGAEAALKGVGEVVATLPHGIPHDPGLCLKCRLEKILSSVPS